MSKIQINAQNDLAILNDEFNDTASLYNWQMHHEIENWPSFIESIEVLENESILKIEPQSSGWYGEYHRGPFLYKEVEGNFTMITKLKVTGKKSKSPRSSYSLAGLMVRNTRPVDQPKDKKGFENWMFLSTGSATKKGKPQFESKNTVNGKSKLKVFPAQQGWVYIAISRIGDTFYQTYRCENEPEWTLLRVVLRSDFQSKVQVGMLAYTDFWSVAFKTSFNLKKFNTKQIKGKPDLIGNFDYIHFYRIEENAIKLEYEEGYSLTNISKNEINLLKLE